MNIVSKRAVDYVTAPSSSKLLRHEDYWAIWLGAFVLIVGLLINYVSLPVDAVKNIAAARATMSAEEAKAPIRTVHGMKPMTGSAVCGRAARAWRATSAVTSRVR